MENEIDSKKIFIRLGFALVIVLGSILISQVILLALGSARWPGIENTQGFTWVLLTVPTYFIGLPVFWLITRKLPSYKSGEKKKLKASQVIKLFLISMSTAYIFNILGISINTIIAAIKGGAVINPLDDILTNQSMLLTILIVGILSPIVEELIFRKIIIDKARVYGDRTAIYFSALAFGLFHGNLSQFFYAWALGLILGYITVKTNTIKYSVILHIMINLTGSVVMPSLVLSNNQVLMLIGGFLGILFLIAGLVLFLKNKNKINVKESLSEASGSKKDVYLNVGMIVYYIACSYMFIRVIIA